MKKTFKIGVFYKLIVLSFSSFIFSLSSFSQDTDIADTIETALPLDSMSILYSFYNDSSVYSPDTTLESFQHYRPTSSPYAFTLGNLGTPQNNLIYSPSFSTGFELGRNAMDAYEFNKESVKFYQVNHSFTEAFYVNGSKREEMFHVVHTQNIVKNFNIGVEYRKIRSEGFYIKQNTLHSNLLLQTNFKTNHSRYGFFSTYINNSISLEENGGIAHDSLFELEYINRKLIDVQLYNASNKIKGRNYFLKQYFNFGFKEENVTTDSVIDKKFVASHQLSHSLFIEKKYFRYRDEYPDSAYYSQLSFKYDSLLPVKDSTFFYKVENEISWNTLDNKKGGRKKHILFNTALKHQIFHIKQNQIDTVSNNLIYSGVVFNNSSTFHYELSGNYVMNGYNKNDFRYDLIIRKNVFKEQHYINFSFFTQKKSPNFIWNYFSSDFVKWNNDFNKMDAWNGDLYYEYTKGKFNIGATYSSINHYIYFDTDVQPKQINEQIKILSLYLHKNFEIGNWHIDNSIIYQKTDNGIIGVPKWTTRNSLYYENRVFKKAVLLSVGIDASYNSALYVDAYLPALQQFYLQAKKEIGDYLYFDAFLNLKIKQVRIFIKTEHFNAGFMEYRYYMVPHYPMPDRTVKVGINWRFYN